MDLKLMLTAHVEEVAQMLIQMLSLVMIMKFSRVKLVTLNKTLDVWKNVQLDLFVLNVMTLLNNVQLVFELLQLQAWQQVLDSSLTSTSQLVLNNHVDTLAIDVEWEMLMESSDQYVLNAHLDLHLMGTMDVRLLIQLAQIHNSRMKETV